MRRLLASVALVGAVAIAPLAVQPSSAQVERGFTAVAEGTVFNMQYGVPGFILTNKFMDQGGTTAQARFESAGVRRANAQSPYLGFLADYPGLVATGGGPSGLPGYPGRALADDATTPEAIVGSESSPYFLKATVSDTAAKSIARVGAPPGGEGASAPASWAKTEIVNEGDTLSVRAETVALGFSLGPLNVQHMSSKAVTTFTDAAGTPTTKTELVASGVSVGGQGFALGPEGEGLDPLNQALAPSGIQVNFASARELEGGAAGAGYEFVWIHPAPGAGEGEGIYRMRFGGVISHINLGTGSDDSDTVTVSQSSPRPVGAPLGVIRRPDEVRP